MVQDTERDQCREPAGVFSNSKRRLPAYFMGAFLLLSMISIAPSLLPSANAITCHTQIMKVDYPAEVGSNENVDVRTTIVASCTTSMIDIAGRVDLVDQTSNRTLSIQGFHVGYVSEPLRVSNFTVTNSAQAPAGVTNWELRIVIRVFAGSELIETETHPLSIHVGSGTVVSSSSTGSSTVSTSTEPNMLFIEVSVVMLIVAAVAALLLRAKRRGEKGQGRS